MKSRFCPSPTGLMTLGNARTALFNVLAAGSQNGQMLLRIEDTDQARSEDQYSAQLMLDLTWLGCDWQDGPYYQSLRQEIYDKYYQILLSQGAAYPCFCSEEQLARNRSAQRAAGQPPRYLGTCRGLGPDEVAAKIQAGGRPTLRFKMPVDEVIAFNDIVRGEQRFASDDIGDFIIRRADGTAAFMFCNAIDDALMNVTHALRGEDHLTNSPRQIAILNTLGLKAPTYAHVSLILGDDGAPLSKRNGSRSLVDLQSEGYLPLAVVNYLARLGHTYTNEAFMSFAELCANFKFDKLGRAPARYDGEQLKRWQKAAVQQSDFATLWAWLPKAVKNQVPDAQQQDFLAVIQPNIMFPHDAGIWADAVYSPELVHSAEGKEILSAAGVGFFEAALEIINQTQVDFKSLADVLKNKLEVRGRQLFMPLRVALTGQTHGPEMKLILPLMGVERARERFEQALFYI